MQAAPAVTVSAGPDGAALVVLCLLSVLAVAACGAWAMERGDALGAVTLIVVAFGSASSLWLWVRQPAVQLRWDGEAWWLASFDAAAVLQAGQLAVAIDLGGWLLLRFRADAAGRWSRIHWLALSRSKLPRDWHLLRCAVYSPHPSPRPRSLAQG